MKKKREKRKPEKKKRQKKTRKFISDFRGSSLFDFKLRLKPKLFIFVLLFYIHKHTQPTEAMAGLAGATEIILNLMGIYLA